MSYFQNLPNCIIRYIFSFAGDHEFREEYFRPNQPNKIKNVIDEINYYNKEYLFQIENNNSPYKRWDEDSVYEFILIQNRQKYPHWYIAKPDKAYLNKPKKSKMECFRKRVLEGFGPPVYYTTPYFKVLPGGGHTLEKRRFTHVCAKQFWNAIEDYYWKQRMMFRRKQQAECFVAF